MTGTHILELNSAGDRIVLTHEAKSRRTFANGAVLAAEWIVGKTGFYDFKDIFMAALSFQLLALSRHSCYDSGQGICQKLIAKS